MFWTKAIGGVLCGIAVSAAAAADAAGERSYPEAGWKPAPSRHASPRAVRGGRIVVAAGSVPRSLNPLLDNNVFSSRVFGFMYESLLGMDDATGEYAPGLASRWTVSADGRAFTFTIDPEARWSDGRPVTAADVKWTFDAIMDPAHLTGPHKVALQTFTATAPEVLAPDRIRFTAGEVHWRNLGAAGGFPVLPSHVFAGRDFNALNFDFPVVSGPYRLGAMKENVSLQMARRPDWWADAKPWNWHLLNFDVVEYRFFSDPENAWDAFRKGLFDYYPVYTARIWVQETHGERFDRNWIVKRAIRNQAPVGFQGFAMNLRRKPYDDVRVRQALAHLLDRETLNATMMYGQYFLHRSYFEDLYDAQRPCPNPFFEFNPAKARTLLAEAGWKPDPATGMLAKDGQPLVVKFLSNGGTSDKFLARYRGDLAAAGVGLAIEHKDWAAWARDMDAYDFDMTWAAWSAGLRKDPEGMWASAQASAEGGNNITGFADPRVDDLIERQKTIFSLAERNDVCREIDGIVAEAVPYILLWNTDATRMLWWNKFGVPEGVLSKYGSFDDALLYWWYDADAAEALQDAMARGLNLPAP
jgi:microcin C transport system substrate-binding protein